MIPARLVTDGVIAFCESILGPLGIDVGDGKAPDGFGPGYLVVARIASGFGADGSYAQPGDMLHFKYQLSAVGSDRQEAEGILDAVTIPFIELDTDGTYVTELTVTGFTVVERVLSTDVGLSSEGSYASIRHVTLLVA